MRLLPLMLAPATLLAISLLPARADDQQKGPTKISLMPDESFAGWDYHLQDSETKLEEVWSIENGMLICKGKPIGYLYTKQQYENYTLSLEWRWRPDAGGNSGVLVHKTTPGALGVWPKSIEVQLHHGNAGDFWVIGTELTVENQQQRQRGRRIFKLVDDAEKPLGEWNHMEVTCRGDEIVVKVNGQLVNHATGVSQTKGSIALQSEGEEVHFRNIVLMPLEEAPQPSL